MNYVFYHANCTDGFGAAFAMWLGFGDSNAKYYPIGLYDAFPSELLEKITKDDTVYVLDFCFDPETLEKIQERSNLQVIDHHEGNLSKLSKVKGFIHNTTKSGALLAYEYMESHKYYGDTNKTLFKYISDADLWTFSLPSSKAISAFLKSYPKDFSIYYNVLLLFQKHFGGCVFQGEAVIRKVNDNVSYACSNAYETTLEVNKAPIKVVATNATSDWSEVGEELLKRHPNVDFSISYRYVKLASNVSHWEYSIRSRQSSFSCIDVAKFFGGSGHPTAAGFSSKDKLL